VSFAVAALLIQDKSPRTVWADNLLLCDIQKHAGMAERTAVPVAEHPTGVHADNVFRLGGRDAYIRHE